MWAVEAGTSRNAMAAPFDMSTSFLVMLLQPRRDRGTVTPDQYGVVVQVVLSEHANTLKLARGSSSATCLGGNRKSPFRPKHGRKGCDPELESLSAGGTDPGGGRDRKAGSHYRSLGRSISHSYNQSMHKLISIDEVRK